ncbi:CBS domain-containing protein, partial [Klebsiella pneumoniae subsp. pneumoniae]
MTRSVETLNADLPLAEGVAARDQPNRTPRTVDDRVGVVVAGLDGGDALGWALEDRDGDAAEGTLGERVSDADLAMVHPGDVVSHAIDVMLAAGQGRLPVTDPQSGRLVGLLTRKDLLQV